MSLPRLASALCCIALGLILASPAAADVKFSLTFSLKSQQYWNLAGWWTYDGSIVGSDMAPPNCTTGGWSTSGYATQYNIFPFQIEAGETDTYVETNNIFSKCSSSDLGTAGEFQTISQFDPHQLDHFGKWSWQAHDPVFSGASLTCSVDYQPTDNPIFQAQVDGFNCTISGADAAPSATFVSSAAPVRDGNAVVLVQLHPGQQSPTTTGRADKPPATKRRVESGRHEVILRDAKGNLLGRERETIVSGKPRAVHVKIGKALREDVAKKGRVTVTAIIRRIDGKPGTGHKTKVFVMKDDASLDF